jgi:hypothetical protein
MSVLKIPYLPAQAGMNHLPLIDIENDPWPQFADESVSASFAISHYEAGIRIRFVAEEPWLRVQTRPHNAEVHLDNCVEFFIAIDGTEGYYNFEFNCLGSVKVGFGIDRNDREHLADELVDVVAKGISIDMNSLENGSIRWELTVDIPLQSFWNHHLSNLAGMACTLNFSKCGDELPVPHFKSWQPIVSPEPDFHQPEAFARAVFLPPNDL